MAIHPKEEDCLLDNFVWDNIGLWPSYSFISSPSEQDDSITEIFSFSHAMFEHIMAMSQLQDLERLPMFWVCVYVSFSSTPAPSCVRDLDIHYPFTELWFCGQGSWIFRQQKCLDTIQSTSQSRWSRCGRCIPSHPSSTQRKQRPSAFFCCSIRIFHNSDIKAEVTGIVLQHEHSYLSQNLTVSCWVIKTSSILNKQP